MSGEIFEQDHLDAGTIEQFQRASPVNAELWCAHMPECDDVCQDQIEQSLASYLAKSSVSTYQTTLLRLQRYPLELKVLFKGVNGPVPPDHIVFVDGWQMRNSSPEL